MTRPTVAILDDQLPIKIAASPDELDGVDVVWTGQSLEDLEDAAARLKPQVLVLQLEHLGRDPIAAAQGLATLAKAELVLVTYAFARREVLRELLRESVRPVRNPLSLPALRAQMTGVIVRSLMSGGAADVSTTETIRPPRYSPSQLAKLESMDTSVQCECPQHVSSILSSLVYFEAYCKECENNNEQDAKLHRLLYDRTARARMLLEDGLEQVLEHEDIRV